MPDLNAMALFVHVVETGSMTAAARLLNLPKSSVSRRIALLEHELNATLLHRSTRSLSLTDTGRAYFDRASPIVREAEQTELDIRSRHARAAGIVRITATVGFGQEMLAPILCELLREEPELRVDLRLTDARVNIIEEGVDLAIRMGRLENSDLLSRKIAVVPRLLCAAPGYLDTNGTPVTPADLQRHSCIVTSADLNRWRFADGTEIAVPWRLAAGGIHLARDAAIGGHGIALLPRFLVDSALADRRLVEVLPAHSLPDAEATALYPSDRIQSLASKIVLERIIRNLSASPSTR